MTRYDRALVAFLMFAVLWAVFPPPASASGGRWPMCHAWEVVSSPALVGGQLAGVSGSGPDDVWTVGFYTNGISAPLIEHWDGTAWTNFPQAGPEGYLAGVVAIAQDDVWAAGWQYVQGNDVTDTLFEHWDGKSWSVIPAPSPGGYDRLSSISAVASDDVWAVGWYTGGKGTIHGLSEHWDGTAWSATPAPDGSTYGTNVFYGVDALTSTDAWAVGYYDATGDADFVPLAEHWDGSTWTVVPTAFGPTGFLYGVGGVASNDVWAVGGLSGYGSSSPMEHWDGTRWTLVRGAQLQHRGATEYAIVPVTADAVWTAGVSTPNWNNLDQSPIAVAWDGVNWVATKPPGPGTRADLFGVGATSGTDIWAVGASVDGDETPLIEHSRGPC